MKNKIILSATLIIILVSCYLFNYFITNSLEINTAKYLTNNYGSITKYSSFFLLLSLNIALIVVSYKNHLNIKHIYICLRILFILIISSLLLLSYAIYKHTIDRGFGIDQIDIIAILQTNFNEALGYIAQFHGELSFSILFISYSLIVSILTIATHFFKFISLNKITFSIISITSIVLLIFSIINNPYNKLINITSGSINEINSTINKEKSLFTQISNQSNNNIDFSFNGNIKNKNKIFLIIIGESQTRDVMSVYTNKFLDTTPFLSKLEREFAFP